MTAQISAGQLHLGGKNSQRQVIVTGATGFVGQHFVPLLINAGFDVLAVSRDDARASSFDWFNKVRWIQHDIGKDRWTAELEQNCALVHLAWPNLPNYNEMFHLEANLPQSYMFIKDLVDRGVAEVLVAGTCFEYGHVYGPINASSQCVPTTPYGIAKNVLRQQLEQLSLKRSFTLQWARLFYMYGTGQNPQSLPAQLDASIKRGDKSFNLSGGEQLRDYLSVEDAAHQLLNLMLSKSVGAVNVCSGEPVSIRRFVENYVACRGSSIQLNFGYYPYPVHEPMAFWGVR